MDINCGVTVQLPLEALLTTSTVEHRGGSIEVAASAAISPATVDGPGESAPPGPEPWQCIYCCGAAEGIDQWSDPPMLLFAIKDYWLDQVIDTSYVAHVCSTVPDRLCHAISLAIAYGRLQGVQRRRCGQPQAQTDANQTVVRQRIDAWLSGNNVSFVTHINRITN